MNKKSKIIIIILAVLLVILGTIAVILINNPDFFSNTRRNSENTQNYYPDLYFKKPVLYFYPENETAISVRLLKDNMIIHSYPKYRDGWNIVASPNGDLKDLDTGRMLYSLYYECKNSHEFDVEKDGFVVKGKDITNFLEDKLAILGLTDKEAEEFIIYWLPILENNNYNYIRFATRDEIEDNMPIDIEPKPDTFIRVMMITKALDEPIEIVEQKLEKVERTGFTVVEWGGSDI